MTVSALRERLALLDVALGKTGRSRHEMEISFETQILVAPDLEGLRRSLEQLAERGRDVGQEPKPEIAAFIAGRTDALPDWMTGPWIVGTSETARARIEELRALGVDHLMLWFMDAPDAESMQLFMSDIATGFR